jgi:hypothetical protein
MRYDKTAKGHANRRRYEDTEKRKIANRTRSARTIWIGHDYHSLARTVEDAKRINRHIQERQRAFKRLQTGTETEGDSIGAVSIEAEAGGD